MHSLARAGVSSSGADARLLALLDELKNREKRRDELLDRLSIEDGDQIEAVPKKACDAARVIYEQIIAIKPTTAAGVLRRLELERRAGLRLPRCRSPWQRFARSLTVHRH